MADLTNDEIVQYLRDAARRAPATSRKARMLSAAALRIEAVAGSATPTCICHHAKEDHRDVLHSDASNPPCGRSDCACDHYAPAGVR
jgi:hypothetical protein